MGKKILAVLGVFILIFVIAFASIFWLVSSANKERGNNEEILKSSQSSKKALVVYQPSVSGVSTKIAYQIAEGLNDGGYEVTLNYPGDHLSADITAYSIVVFGTPTFGAHPVTVLADYMKKVTDYSSSKVVLFSTGANPEGKELDEMEELLNTSAYKKVKFKIGTKENEAEAYDLGKALSKE